MGAAAVAGSSCASEKLSPDCSSERWRPVVGHDGYDVSDHGRVRSWRKEGGGRRVLPRLRKLQPLKTGGYMSFMLIEGKKPILLRVHIVLLEAFVGARPDGFECRHLDGDVKNNRLSNLCWGTSSQNTADQIRHGTDTRGERNGGAKFTHSQVAAIRSSTRMGKELAEEFGVAQSTISRIRHRIRYACLDSAPVDA